MPSVVPREAAADSSTVGAVAMLVSVDGSSDDKTLPIILPRMEALRPMI
jgi:hypothetical protein